MPRHVQGALLPPPAGPRVRRADVYRTLRDAILDGTLGPGARLPSTRELAAEYQMSRTTLEDLYEQLVSEGLIGREVGRGSFVADIWPAGGRGEGSPAARVRLSKRGRRLGREGRCREVSEARPFNAGVPDAGLFPMNAWERCYRQAQREAGSAALNHADARGYGPLRAALARYLAQFRGVRACAEQVVVFNSTSQALQAFFLLLLDRGDAVWVEDPGYPGAAAAARVVGARAVPVPVDGEGVRVAAGRALGPGARVAYVTPAHQYPTGAMLTPARRRELLDWAEAEGAVVVEDDYDADFRYHGEPLTTLHALSGGRRVFYVGTLSKAMFLGLRVAYAIVPESFVEPLANVRAQIDGFSAAAVQIALARFLDEGRLAAHVRQARRAYAEKRALLLELLAPMAAAGWAPGPANAGLHFVLYEPRAGLADRVARSSGLALNTLGDYATAAPVRDGLLLRFGGLSEGQLRAGAAGLCAAARRAGQNRPSARGGRC
jgi:GntR family transcriptional regulator / MocR family aminotransferase